MLARIHKAERTKEKKVADATNDKLAKARRLAAYDGMALSRAILAENAISRDPMRRLGGYTLEAWKSRLSAAEEDAAGSGFEGRLALALKEMSTEDARGERHFRGLGGHFDAFDQAVPTLFGGAMRGDLEAARADLDSLRKSELGPEDSLYEKVVADMRRRVSDRLYGEREDFRTRRDRYDALAALYDDGVHPAASQARDIDSDLQSVSSNLTAEQINLGLAAMNTRVPVPKTKIVSDGKGGTRTETYTVYEDHSGFYKALAAAAAAAADEARNSFSPILQMLADLEGEVGQRRDGEDAWVNAQISADLASQMGRARAQKAK
jgi:hypothetical protein